MIFEHLQQKARAKTLPQRQMVVGITKEQLTEIAGAFFGENTNYTDYAEDFLFIEDKGTSFRIDWSDAAKKEGQNENETARGLIKWGNKKPKAGGRRLIIIENLERGGVEAQNALLKLIEEPPSYLWIIITTKNPYQILETIRSRTGVVYLPPKPITEDEKEPILGYFEAKNSYQRLVWITKTEKTYGKDDKRGDTKKMLTSMMKLAREIAPNALPMLQEVYNYVQANGNLRLAMLKLAKGFAKS